jgi:hypothetical protein
MKVAKSLAQKAELTLRIYKIYSCQPAPTAGTLQKQPAPAGLAHLIYRSINRVGRRISCLNGLSICSLRGLLPRPQCKQPYDCSTNPGLFRCERWHHNRRTL